MVLILFKRQPIELTSLSVSVPLRGLWFLSAENPLDFTWWQEQDVSVPLRGLWFLSQLFVGEYSRKISMFPSPYGDYGSYLRLATCLLMRQA